MNSASDPPVVAPLAPSLLSTGRTSPLARPVQTSRKGEGSIVMALPYTRDSLTSPDANDSSGTWNPSSCLKLGELS